MLRKIIVFPIISAVLLTLTYPKFNLWPLAWISFIPLFFALDNENPKQRFIAGYIYGIVFFTGILYWLFIVSVPGAILLILLLSIAPALFSSLYIPLPNLGGSGAQTPGVWGVLLVPAAWVLTEYLRTHLFTGFPWTLLGYSQSVNLPFAQIADITGVYGVSFLIILVNFGIYLVLKKAPKRFYTLFFILLISICVFAYGQGKMRKVYPAQNLKVVLIQGNIPQEVKWDPAKRHFIMDKYAFLTEDSMKEAPGLIVWPETAMPGYLEEDDIKKMVTNLAKSANAHLLTGTIRDEADNFYNSATLISNKGEILQSYDKIHLVPFGEFIPFEGFIPWIRGAVDKPIGDFRRGKGFTVFEFAMRNASFRPERIRKITEFYKFGTLICFEDIFPDLSRRFVKKGARFLVNITNDAWFGKTVAPYQHMQCSIFRAIENRVPVIRAANTGVSCIIDHRGKVIECVRVGNDEIFVDGYAAGTISPVFVKTFYTRFGDVFSWVCIGFVLLISFLFKRKL